MGCFFVFAKIWKFLKIKLWPKAIIKVEPFFEGPDKKLGVENYGLEQTNIFTRPKIWKSFLKVMHFCKTVWEISDFFNISHILNFWKMLFRSLKKVCDEFSKIKNLRCRFSLFFHADRHEITLICHILLFLGEKWPRKWAIFLFFIISWFLKIAQHVLQKYCWWRFKNQKYEM